MSRKLSEYNKVCCFDTETTGTRTKPEVLPDGTIIDVDQIIELGLVVYGKDENGKFTKQLVKKDLFVKTVDGRRLEDMVISRTDADGNSMTIASLTGITTKMLETSGVTEKEMVDEVFHDIFDKDTLILGYNLGFDLRMILNAIHKYYPAFVFEGNYDALDAMTMYKDFYAYDSNLGHDGNKLGQRLDAAVSHLKVTVQNTHRACDDADATWEVFKELYKQIGKFQPYVNTFGYNPKFGLQEPISGIRYFPQGFRGVKEVLCASAKEWYKNHPEAKK